jgi:hypothetical protein
MYNKWKNTAYILHALTEKYSEKKQTPQTEIHQEILLRSMKLLEGAAPEATELIQPMVKIMLPYTVLPDDKDDRENGAGRHYYCACNTDGRPFSPVGGYYRNGKDLFARSARTMFEEDYTMALTMYHAGFTGQSAVYLGRAVHMMSDMCCLPHTVKWTYFSKKRSLHICYEELAHVMYPEFVPEQTIGYEHLRRFAMRSSFTTALNMNAEKIAREIPELTASPETEIKKRLYDTEQAVAALLYRFYRDTKVTPLRGHYAADGMVCHPFADMPALDIRITERGITFELAGLAVNSRLGSVFRAAHRRGGKFSLTPVGCNSGLVLSRNSRKLVPFDPRDEKQLYGII